MPVSGLGHLRAKSLFVNESILSNVLITRLVSKMPQLTTLERISLPKIQNGAMVYDIEIDDLLVYKQNQWTSLTVSTIDPTQPVHLTNNTPSTNTETGALIIDGGVAFKQDLNINGSVDIGEILTIGDDSESIDELSGALVVSGGVGIGKNINVGGNVIISGTVEIGEGTSGYSFPSTIGEAGQVLSVSTDGGFLEFSTSLNTINNINSEFPFTTDDLLVKTKDTGITETGISITNDNNISGINTLSLGSGTSSYTFPNMKGTPGQILVLSTSGTLLFETTGISPNSITSTLQFGTDNVLLRSDGVSRNAQSTGIIINDNDSMSGVESLSISGTSDSSSISTGSLIVSGGVGISKNVNIGGELVLNTGTASYSFPTSIGLGGTALMVSTGGSTLEFSEVSLVNNINSEFPFTSDDRIVKTKDTGITETGISINTSNDMSGINILTLGTGTSGYSFPNEIGNAGQVLVLSTSGSLIFETTTISSVVVNSPSPFGTDNILVKSDGTGRDVQPTGISISDLNNVSGINILTLGSGTSGYSFPNEIGNAGQVLVLSTTGSLIFETTSISSVVVNSPSPFGADNILVKSDGTDRDVQPTGISISDLNDITGVGDLTLNGTTSSISSTTGALLVTGGVGIGENLNVSNNITFNGRLNGRVRDVITDTTLDDDYIVNVASGTGGTIITLPDIQNYIYTGVTYMIIKENSNNVTINTDNANDKITSGGNEVTSFILTGDTNERITLVSNGKKWVTM